MIQPKDITVVIPAYNRAEMLPATLRSFIEQRVRPGRLIIVDNNSSDDTLKVAREWAAEHRSDTLQIDVLEEREPGACAARNCGLKAVKTPWVSFFDSDDLMLPDMYQKICEAKGDADIIYWKLALCVEGKKYVKPFSRKQQLQRHVYNALLSTQRSMARTELVRRAGGWGDTPVWDDWELGFRLLGLNPKMEAIPEVLCEAIAHDDSITGASFSAKQGLWEHAIEMNESSIKSGKFDWNGFSKDKLQAMMDYVRVILASHYRKEGNRKAAERLLSQTLRNSKVSAWRRMLLKLIYHYTRLGGRGAYLLWY